MEKDEQADKTTAGSRRMDILQQSLAKKQAAFDQRLQVHFDDVKSANGQPLNDKRIGRQTLDRWERQNDGLRSMQESIEKTQRAIEREQHKIDKVAGTKIPECLKPMLASGDIIQWRKYPNRFFVKGVEKARIIWFEDKQEFGYSHLQGVKGEQYARFRDTYNNIRALHRQERETQNMSDGGTAERGGQQSMQTVRQEAGLSESVQTASEGIQDITDKSQPFAHIQGSPPEPLPSLTERLQKAKQEYDGLTASGNATDKKIGLFLQVGMEKLIKGLPEQTQLQVRVNFYENMIGRINGKSEPDKQPEQQDLFAER